MQYGIGLPLGSFLLLYKFRHRLHTDKFRFRLGLLYSGYRHDRWWWENVVAARKVIIICFSSIWFNETIQVHLVLGLMMLLLVAHYSFLPYDTTTKEGRLLHKVERNSLVALISMLWAGVVFLMDSDQKCNSTLCIYVHNALVLLVILINVLLLSHGSYLFVYFFCKRNHLLEKIDTYQIRNKIASSLHLRLRLPSLSSLSPLSRPSSTSNLSGIEMKDKVNLQTKITSSTWKGLNKPRAIPVKYEKRWVGTGCVTLVMYDVRAVALGCFVWAFSKLFAKTAIVLASNKTENPGKSNRNVSSASSRSTSSITQVLKKRQ